jgi:hypothetical protein
MVDAGITLGARLRRDLGLWNETPSAYALCPKKLADPTYACFGLLQAFHCITSAAAVTLSLVASIAVAIPETVHVVFQGSHSHGETGPKSPRRAPVHRRDLARALEVNLVDRVDGTSGQFLADVTAVASSVTGAFSTSNQSG